jgi:hypothetical protein
MSDDPLWAPTVPIPPARDEPDSASDELVVDPSEDMVVDPSEGSVAVDPDPTPVADIGVVPPPAPSPRRGRILRGVAVPGVVHRAR